MPFSTYFDKRSLLSVLHVAVLGRGQQWTNQLIDSKLGPAVLGKMKAHVSLEKPPPTQAPRFTL